MTSAERQRVEAFGHLENGLRQAGEWYRWGPYVSERQWGTVREDYSADGEAWDHFPHEHARSRAYRWGEDGMAGFCDVEQRLCVALALWNGRDPILKERMFGLNGSEGNHGEDVKEHWWYVDAVPSHVWNRWRYHYPQQAFPYEDLVAENARRSRTEPEYELLDTGAFDEDRYWIVELDLVKAAADDLLVTVRVTNAGPEADTLHVLPTAWFRNTWAWEVDEERPRLRAAAADRVHIDHPLVGPMELICGPDAAGEPPTLLFCENETNTVRLFDAEPITPFPKDGIGDHVVTGAPTVNPDRVGTKVSAWYRLDVAAGATAEVRLRLRPLDAADSGAAAATGDEVDAIITTRRAEADEFYAELTPPHVSADEAHVMRQAFAGMLWSKQLFYYDVDRWLDGDPTQPPPPEARRTGRNARWRHFAAFDLMSMPDKWEYPWFAAWDLSFHCVALAHVDPAFAKYQLLLLCREWFQHPNGALPAYEWDFGDVNPPVQAWAALEVFAIDGARDLDFLSRVFDKLLVNFTWWVNLEDADGSNLFEGGFLGLDNIGPIDRSHLPVGGRLEQSDATGWMAAYALSMASIATILHQSGRRPATDLIIKFLEHFVGIREAMDTLGVWDEEDGLYYDELVTADGERVALKVRSMVGVIPLFGSLVLGEDVIARAETLGKQFASAFTAPGARGRKRLIDQGMLRGERGDRRLLLGVVGVDHLRKVLTKLFDEDEFLTPHGLRALSRYHRDHPYVLELDGIHATIDYEPAESTTPMFGGNSNWRGPVWFPLNYLLIAALERYHRFFGEELTVPYPTASGPETTLDVIAADLRRRLISLFLLDDAGRRPCLGGVERLQSDPGWRDNLVFHEYFNGDDGAGLGASHQTGWTGLVADLIRGRPGSTAYTVGEIGHVLLARRDHASDA